MADLGPLATKNTAQTVRGWAMPNWEASFPVTKNMGQTVRGWATPNWAGYTVQAHYYRRLTHRTFLAPAWWGSKSPNADLRNPTHEIRGRVMQRNPDTQVNTPLALARVALFYRRHHTFIAGALSDADGYVVFKNLMPENQAYYAIAFDPEGAPLQNAVIWDRLSSVPEG